MAFLHPFGQLPSTGCAPYPASSAAMLGGLTWWWLASDAPDEETAFDVTLAPSLRGASVLGRW